MAKKQSHLPIQIFANIFGGDILEYECNTDFTRLTTKIVDRLVTLDGSTDWNNLDLGKVNIPDDLKILYDHVGEFVDISLYGEKWDLFDAEKFVEGVSLRFADEYLHYLYFFDVDGLIEEDNFKSLLHNLKGAVALFQANGLADDQIVDLFLKKQEEYCQWRKKVFESLLQDILSSSGEGRLKVRLAGNRA